MDREFMKEFYDKMYEDPVGDVVKNDEEYAEVNASYHLRERKLFEELGGVSTDLGRLYEKITDDFFRMQALCAKNSYLLGAEDREKMLR